MVLGMKKQLSQPHDEKNTYNRKMDYRMRKQGKNTEASILTLETILLAKH
jgi:hypothetical protein